MNDEIARREQTSGDNIFPFSVTTGLSAFRDKKLVIFAVLNTSMLLTECLTFKHGDFENSRKYEVG